LTPPAVPIFPPDRYGHRRAPGHRSRLLPAVLVIVAALAIAWLTLHLYTQYGTNPYQLGAVRYGEVAETHVTGSFDVAKPASRTGVCRLRALDRIGAETGYAEVTVGTGSQPRRTPSRPGLVPSLWRSSVVLMLHGDFVPW
jgi:hypothetical protein